MPIIFSARLVCNSMWLLDGRSSGVGSKLARAPKPKPSGEQTARFLIQYGMVWYGMVWYGMVRYGMVWNDLVWYGMVYGMVWYGIVRYRMV